MQIPDFNSAQYQDPAGSAFDHYRALLGHTPLLSRARERELGGRMQRGCRLLLLLLASDSDTRHALVASLDPAARQHTTREPTLDPATLSRLAALPVARGVAARLRQRRDLRRWLLPVVVDRRELLQVVAGCIAHNRGQVCPRLQRCHALVQAARRQLIQANLRLVLHIATGFSSVPQELQDLVQEGNLGLMTAVDRFDPARGCRFSTYAWPWIRVSIQNGLMDRGDTIRLPRNLHEQLGRLRRHRRACEQRHGRVPGAVALAHDSGLDPERVRRLGQLQYHTVSLQQPPYPHAEEDGEEWLADPGTAGAVDGIQADELRQHLSALMDQLEPRLRRIVILRHGLEGVEPQTCEQVGRALGLSRERVRQLEISALGQLRTLARARHPDHLQLRA